MALKLVVLNDDQEKFLKQYIGAKFQKRTNGDHDPDELVDWLGDVLQEKREILVREDSAAEVDRVLGNPELLHGMIPQESRGALRTMLTSAIDHGTVDPNNEQHLVLFYRDLKAQMGLAEGGSKSGEAIKQDRIEQEAKAEADLQKERENFRAYQGAIYEVLKTNAPIVDPEVHDPDDPVPPKVFKIAIEGVGASVANYLANAGSGLDPGSTIILGESQPWGGERGKQGVVNQPTHEVAPEGYQGSQLVMPAEDKGGLGTREGVADKIDAVIKRFKKCWFKAKVTKSTKQRTPSVTYYELETNKGTRCYAQRVIAGVGIGKHKVPAGITGLKATYQCLTCGKTIDNEPPQGAPPTCDNAECSDRGQALTDMRVGKKTKHKRMMDMDEFKRAIDDGEFVDEIDSVVVIGPNAVIDVVSCLRRERPSLKVFWVTKAEGRPVFLPGMDNDPVLDVYNKATKPANKKGNKNVFELPEEPGPKKAGKVTIIQYDYLGAAVGGDGVVVTYGRRPARGSKDKQQPCGKQRASIAVYGVGPDTEAVVANAFPQINEVTQEEGAEIKTASPLLAGALFPNDPSQVPPEAEAALTKHFGEVLQVTPDEVDAEMRRRQQKNPASQPDRISVEQELKAKKRTALLQDLVPELAAPTTQDVAALTAELFADPPGDVEGLAGDVFPELKVSEEKLRAATAGHVPPPSMEEARAAEEQRLAAERKKSFLDQNFPAEMRNDPRQLQERMTALMAERNRLKVEALKAPDIQKRITKKLTDKLKEKKKKEIELEPIYDIDQHFNYNTADPKYNPDGSKSPKDALQGYLTSDERGAEKLTPEQAEHRVRGVGTIIGSMKVPKRDADGNVMADAQGKVEFEKQVIDGLAPLQSALPARIPVVVGVKVKRRPAQDGVADDATEMEFIGASVPRVLEEFKVPDTFVSQTYDGLLKDIDKAKAKAETEGPPFDNAETQWAERFKATIETASKLAMDIEKLEAVDTKRTPKYQAFKDEIVKLRDRLAGVKTAAEGLAKPAKGSRLLPFHEQLTKQMVPMLAEALERRTLVEADGKTNPGTAAGSMKAIVNSLPQNIALNDQLTSLRSAIEAEEDAMPANVAEGVNLIASDQTVIAGHIAARYPNIPAGLAADLGARIIYERRNRDAQDGGAIPQAEDPSDPHTTFHIQQQIEFQEGWNDKLQEIDNLLQGKVTEEEAQKNLGTKQCLRTINGLRDRGKQVIHKMQEWNENPEWVAYLFKLGNDFANPEKNADEVIEHVQMLEMDPQVLPERKGDVNKVADKLLAFVKEVKGCEQRLKVLGAQ